MKFSTFLLAILLSQGCVFSGDQQARATENKHNDKKGAKKHAKQEKYATSPEVSIVRQWDLPAELKEISGLCYIDKDRFACVQDELGKIYIYNTASEKIERVIPVASAGDYEGLAIVGNTAYIVRSDGVLYEVNDIRSDKSAVKSYTTPLTAAQNVEGLCYDKSRNRLLLAIKNLDPSSADYKGIYEFNIRTKTLSKAPAYKIYLNDAVIGTANAKKKSRPVSPSGIMRHPSGQDLYILDGPSSGLLVMDQSGKLKQHYFLGSSFAKAEGITFSPDGKIYVSNEGKKQAPNIIELKLAK